MESMLHHLRTLVVSPINVDLPGGFDWQQFDVGELVSELNGRKVANVDEAESVVVRALGRRFDGGGFGIYPAYPAKFVRKPKTTLTTLLIDVSDQQCPSDAEVAKEAERQSASHALRVCRQPQGQWTASFVAVG